MYVFLIDLREVNNKLINLYTALEGSVMVMVLFFKAHKFHQSCEMATVMGFLHELCINYPPKNVISHLKYSA